MTIKRPIRRARLVAVLALAGLGLVAADPAYAFYGSFWQSCRNVRIYGGGNYMTAWCRRIDGGWTFSSIYNCGGARRAQRRRLPHLRHLTPIRRRDHSFGTEG